jgi:Protein of unknown function (DUF3810)
VSRRVQIAVIVLAVAAALAPIPATFIERVYSRGVYPRVQRLVTTASGVVPFALIDVAAIVFLVILAAAVARSWRRSGALAGLRRLVAILVVTSAAVYLWFLAFWGFNYRRVPLEHKLVYDAGRISREPTLAIARHAVVEVNALAPSVRSDPGSDAPLRQAFADVERRFGAARATVLTQPKRSALTWYFRKAAIDGMTDPLFLEVIVNRDVLPFERPAVLAHEWAHLAGYADESEANFIAWLVCIGGTPAARYSGWLSAYQHLSGALPREDRRMLRAALSPAVVSDLEAAGQRFARSSPTVRAAAQGAYDSYLKANRIEEGIANYNAVVRLIVGTTFDAQWTPQLRQQ